MALGDRLQTLRRELDLSQEALGAQGFISTPGWIKIENGQRLPSEKLIEKLVKWLVSDKHIKANTSSALREELLTLKYMGSNSAFVREMAKAHAKKLPNGTAMLAEEVGTYKVIRKRGRPPKNLKP